MSSALRANDTDMKSSLSRAADSMSRRSLSVSAGAESPPPCLFKPFVIREPSALLHAATDARACDLLDLEHDEAVVEQQRVAGNDVVA